MKDWKEIIETILSEQSNSVARINLATETVSYSDKIKHNRTLKALTGDEEIVRAFLIDRLVNELDYKPENLETEKQYTINIGRRRNTPRIDLLVKDAKDNPFFFVELKAPDKFEEDKGNIEGQLFALASVVEEEISENIIFPDLYIKIQLDETVIDKKYLAFLFNSFFGRLYFKYVSKGKNQTMVKISSSELYNFYLPLPEIKTQKIIVEKIQYQIDKKSKIDTEIEKNIAKINLIIEESINQYKC